MFNFITQHRRGSTQEWNESNVIPRNGELILEECSDGITRIKIGNGKSSFNELKYIDEKTAAEIVLANNRISELVRNEKLETNDISTEIQDLRVSKDNIVYPCAGDALRAVESDVADLRNGLSQYINSSAVDGLHYQDSMLYLTANGDILEESGVQIVSGSGGGGGGASGSSLKISYVTTSPVIATPNDKVALKFIFSGTDSSGDPILQASATWKLDGQVIAYGTVQDGENTFDVTPYLKVGTSKVFLTVTDDTGYIVTKTWSVQQIDVRLESPFDDTDPNPVNEEVLFDLIPHGAVDKTLHIFLDGKELDPVVYSAKISNIKRDYPLPAQSHGAYLVEAYLTADINGVPVESKPHVLKDVIWYDPTAKDPVIGTTYQKFTSKQYMTTNITFTVYDPSTETPEVTIWVDNKLVSTRILSEATDTYDFNSADIGEHTIEIKCRNTVKTLVATIEDIELEIAPVTTGLVFDFNPVGRSNTDIDRLWSYDDIHMTVSENFDWINGGYRQDDEGIPYFCIKSGTRAFIDYKLFGDDAKKNGKEFKIVFKTTNVSDSSKSFLSCIDNTTDTDHIGIDMKVHEARVYGQSGSLDLAYSEEDRIEFEINISKRTEDVPMIMGYEDGVCTRPLVYTSSYNFKQNTPKDITIGSDTCDVHIYRMKVYDTSLTDVDILNNFIADACTSDEMISRYTRNQIYDENQKLTPEVLAEKCPWLRVYKLSAPHFTNNKSDKVAHTTIQQIYKDGDPVLDNWTCYNCSHSGQGTSSNNYGAAGRNLDFILNKSQIEGVKPYFILGDGKTEAKKITMTRKSVPVAYLNAKVNIASSNNLTNAILASRYNEFNPYRRPFVRDSGEDISFIKDTMEFHNCVIFIQETDPDMSTHREFADNEWHFYAIGNIGDSKKTDNTRATDPDDRYECCVEIMDISLPLSDFPKDTMINAMGYTLDEKTEEKIYTWATNDNLDILYERKFTKTTDEKVDQSKTYYVLIDGKYTLAESQYIEVKEYIWAKDENLGILYEFNGEDYVLTDDTTVDLNKTYYIQTEVKDDLDNVIDVKYSNAMGYTIKTIKTNNWVTDDNIENLYELEYYLTKDTEVNYDKTYYVDILEHDDFSEDYTYGWRYLWEDGSDEENAEVFRYCKQKWIDFYRFVTTSSEEEFKRNLKDYFVVDSALYYYLFTTRYCMVDNRAKNTFWHYSKTTDKDSDGNPIRKWDLCWDYDNDTSLGLNNYGKQVYRYGLEDTDRDSNNNEIFREMDSLFFCRIRDLFSTELRTMYRDLESENAWHAASFLNVCDAWQEEFPEELWRLDIERKYIRTYTHSFINGPGDSQFLENMANGRMKYQRRQWERNQEKYMASKYQTSIASGDTANAQFRAGKAADGSPIPADYQFTLTPNSYMYLTVRYGGTGVTPITVRVKEPGKPVTVPYIGTYDDLIYVYSASEISDFGDLAPMYLQTASIGNAPRVKNFKLGDGTLGYTNPNFTSLTTSANTQLEYLNIENLINLKNTLDLSEFTNLKQLKAKGCGVNSIDFAEGGKLNLVEAPALNSLKFKNLFYLPSEYIYNEETSEYTGIFLESYNNVLELSVENCPLIDSLELLDRCPNIQRVRLIDVDFGEQDYEEFTTRFFPLKGFDKDNTITENAWLTGTVKFDKLSGTQYNSLATRYPHLDIKFNELSCSIRFFDTDFTTEFKNAARTVVGYDNRLPRCDDPVSLELIAPPVKEQTISHVFEWFGWSDKQDYEPLENSILENITNDLILYPTFSKSLRKYPVRFYNNDNSLLNSYDVEYSTSYFEYPEGTPVKANTAAPEAYEFKGWSPEPRDIRGELDCYATYELKPEAIYELTPTDFEYTLNLEQQELTITKYIADKTIIRIADSYIVNGIEYFVTSVGGFENKLLEYVALPEKLNVIAESAFKDNNRLASIRIPENVNTIYHHAFAKCTDLTDVYYDAISATVPKVASGSTGNPFYEAVSKHGFVVHVGKEVVSIPNYLFSAGVRHTSPKLIGARELLFEENCLCTTINSSAFAYSNLEKVELPSSLITINDNVFNSCCLVSVVLPKNLTKIGSSTFEDNSTLETVYIPASLTTIGIATFRGCYNIEFTLESGSRFNWINNCLVDTIQKQVVFGVRDVDIPDDAGITSLHEHSLSYTTNTELVVPEGIELIGQSAISYCANLEKLTLPKTLTKIDSFGICYNRKLTQLDLPSELAYIGSYTFGRLGITSVVIPSKVSRIGNRAFTECLSLEYVDIQTPTTNYTISDGDTWRIFEGCPSLKRVKVCWASDDPVYEHINAAAPWGATSNNIIFEYTDKELTYNIV